MAKKIANDLVEEFVKDSIALEKLQIKVAVHKAKLRKLQKSGAEHPLLRFEPNVSWRPPWQVIVRELCDKYMGKGPKSVFFNKTLPKRFPKTNGKPSIVILAPRYTDFRESVTQLKKKLGLVSERA